MVKRSKAKTETFYRRLPTEQVESGLSIRAFAAKRGIPAGTLSSWQHELRRRDRARARAGERTAKSGFVQVDVVGAGSVVGSRTPEPAAQAEPASTRPAVYEVVLGQGRVLRLPAEFDEARVAALVRAVASC